MTELPVAVIGAGPQGLAAAAHLLERGLEPLVLEAGDGPAPAVSEWECAAVLQAPRRIAPGIDPNIHSCCAPAPSLLQIGRAPATA
jgi:cation diffusion facilitator CzcD-associated flavoprotein CzcO